MGTLDFEIKLFEDRIKEFGFKISSIKRYKNNKGTTSMCIWIKNVKKNGM